MRSYAGAKAFSIPCGQCMGCRLDKAREWATRLSHEAQLHEENAFLTLTFSDEHLPLTNSVDVRDVQLFMKRLRKSLGDRLVRFFACGEYGDRTYRPHYHLILFGHQFPDLVPWRRTGSGYLVYRSAQLEKLWPYGHCEVGSVTTQSAGYVARYVTKKVHGDDEQARQHYLRGYAVNPETGEERVWYVRREFIVMSRRPGIGDAWFEKYSSDAFPSDFVVIDGVKTPVPRYYSKKLDEREALLIKSKRKEKASHHVEEQTTRRLTTKHHSQQLKAQRLLRKMDEEL